uniref:Uncharacterized protein n=1 Tax=Anguilla anguilla TaxID=7936 RepID=A0A0E9V6L6_ANGAN
MTQLTEELRRQFKST